MTATYDDFAHVYDRLMGDTSVRRYGSFVSETLEGLDGRRLKILDLACGSGRFASYLLQRGHEVTGVDLSPKMLTCARFNAPGARFEHFDMNAPVQLGRRFDAIICLFDSVNHLLSISAVTRLFTYAREAIASGGVFIFDVNTADGFAARWKGGLSYIQSDLVVAGTPSWNSQSLRGIFALAWFERSDELTGGWTRHDTRIEEAAYSDADLSAALKAAGFARFQNAEMMGEAGRTFWIARV
ncbi:SAM-dependent methyltransferase [Bradyrhizobium sp. USDA 372]